MSRHGLILGKFMPVHQGHQYLLDFARSMTSDLTVVVGSLGNEPIPGWRRVEWLTELYGNLEILHLTDENPQLPDEDPDFWNIWQRSLQRIVKRPIDLLFASEDYGARLAQVLGAKFIPTSGGRDLFEVSGTAVRENPRGHWAQLPPCVQAFYGKRVLIFGPESTGKTTLANWLAQRFEGLVVPEYARTYLRGREKDFGLEDMSWIAQAQRASEEASARRGRPLIFCDTDPLTTALWSQELFGEVPQAVEQAAEHNPYDVTLLLNVDVPWEQGPLRLRPHNRTQFFAQCRDALERRGRPFVTISGSWDERRERAVHAITNFLPSDWWSAGPLEQEESRK